MAGLTPAEVAQLYNDIYSAPAPGPAPLPTLTLQQMYNGIYGSAAASPNPPTPPAPPSPPTRPAPTTPAYDVYEAIYGPANLSDQPGSYPTFGQLATMFPGSSRTQTQQAIAAPANSTGYQSGFVKQDNERLLGSLFGGGGASPSPAPSMVAQAAMPGMPRPRPDRPDQVVASIATPGMPRPRPATGGAVPSASPLAALFSTAKAAPGPAPLEVTMHYGAAPARKIAPVPAPLSQRPVAPRGSVGPSSGGGGGSTWAPQGYTNDGSGRIVSNETGGIYYERHLR